MRDPKRIDEVLEVLRKVWKQYPDWRLLQLMSNSIPSGRDGFFIEDNELVEILNAMDFQGGRKQGIAK